MTRALATASRILVCAFSAIIGAACFGGSIAVAENATKLTGTQIRTRMIGMQHTDEVHYRFVYERDGTLRSYAMGVKKIGKWIVGGNELCLYLQERDDGCYEVSISGGRIEMKPSGLGGSIDGILQPADSS